ncbi:cyclodeaminase/cyclohydrolase family protein [Kutzneria sp. CA-103260]|uniref:cyclodeaminase/cyclohydrolase family protein n=1 Tax=Kutzneria sp. CA-103260 TaxID=2802641 RepID=UPI001BAB6932|nr:cyclodeaminase/cyclohydrolase family protein [Kutzneria sp. CA-103260]QUQ72103.1 Methenyltetrahydrofolate cyclohydrolase [Kutzneria sp. CA-103260]
MQEQTIGDWLGELASAEPAPGGGAVAAMHAAMAAGLVSMVCELTVGRPKYAEHEQTMRAVLKEAGERRQEAIELAAADAKAFKGVTDAYKLPKASDEEKARRSEAIQGALAEAAEVPLRTAELAREILGLAKRIRPGANVNVLSDVAVAAVSARAAMQAAAVNVAVNRASMTDVVARARLEAELARIGDEVAAAEKFIEELA